MLGGQSIVADDPAFGGAVLGDTDEALSLQYLKEIWDVRSDLVIVTSQQAAEWLESSERPLYATRNALGLVREEVAEDARFSSAGLTLARVGKTFAWHTAIVLALSFIRVPMSMHLGEFKRPLHTHGKCEIEGPVSFS